MAPALVSAGLVELLRTNYWDTSPWSEDEAPPAALVAWCRDSDPVAFALALAERAACPIIVVSQFGARTPALPVSSSGGHEVRYLDLHVAPGALREYVRTAVRWPVGAANGGVRLSGRELDVLVLLAQGLTNAEIAKALHLGRESVKSHVASILRKTGQENRRSAVRHCTDQGLIGQRLER